MITAAELVRFTGTQGPEVEFQAQQALGMAGGLVDAYCRGRHKRLDGSFKPGVEDVITTVAARILANPEQIQVREEVGPYTYFRGAGFQGFTLVELAVLNRYRKRAI